MARSTKLSLPACVVLIAACTANGQVNVLTYHNDNARTGQNLSETTLTPQNVNVNQFGKLYSINVDGYVFAQPLVLSNVSYGGKTVNMLFVATENDSLYAIDATNGFVLWQLSFINPSAGITPIPTSAQNCDALGSEAGITGTPVIDPNTGTIYLVVSTEENGAYVQRLHAIDVVSHAEKFKGPVVIQATVAGTGSGSQNGVVSFDPLMSNQRAALLLENGHVIIAWASNCDISPYHGWVMSYNAANLAQEAVFGTSPNGDKSGVWQGGAGLAADAKFNIYTATGDGDYDGVTEWGDSILQLTGPAAGAFTVPDWFTPYNQAYMDANNKDVASGGVLLLPPLSSGTQLLVQAGKLGTIYLINTSQMGNYCSSCTSTDTQIVQELQGQIAGVFGMPAYWNGNVYFGGAADNLKAFSFNANNNGLLSIAPTSESPGTFGWPGTTPSISANGTSNAIVWTIDNTAWDDSCCQLLHAFDPTNLATEYYNTDQAANNRDVPGGAVKFTVPTIANGRVYIGSQVSVTIYGLFASVAATPTLSPPSGTYSVGQQVTISDTSPGTTIYYTTNGTAPTTSSAVYTRPIVLNTTTTINAIAVGNGLSASPVATATYTIQAATPTFNPPGGTYSSAQSVTISDASSGTTIYYTTNGTTPTTSSTVYTGAIPVSTTTTIKAIASGGGFSTSAVASATYTIGSGAGPSVSQKNSGVVLNGSSVTVAFANSVNAGDLLIACAMAWASDTYTIQDSNSNTWSLITQKTDVAGDSTAYCWYAANAKAGSTSVTVTGSSKTAIYLITEEVTGVVTSSPLDTFGTATGTGNGSVTTSGSVAQSTEYVLAFFGDWYQDSTWTAGTGYSSEVQINDSSGGASCFLEDESSSSLSGKITATASRSASSAYWVGIIATFK